MKDRDLTPPTEPLPDHIAALLAAERSAPPVADALRERLLSRIEATVAPPLGGATADAASGHAAAGATAGAKAAGALKLMLVLAAVGGIGAWAFLSQDDRATEATTRAAASRPESDPPARPEAAARPEPAAGPSTEAPDEERAEPPRAETVAAEVEATEVADVEGVEGRVEHRELPGVAERRREPRVPEHIHIATARQALEGGDHAAAADAIARHRRAYPRGLLAEEREVIAVRLAVATGRTDLARRLRERFRTRFPESIHLRGLDALVP